MRHGQETICLALNVIHQHASEKSRFLRGALIDEAEMLTVRLASRDDWEREARKLELQGKREQATDIRRRIVKQQAVP